jgi:hypothetical protein
VLAKTGQVLPLVMLPTNKTKNSALADADQLGLLSFRTPHCLHRLTGEDCAVANQTELDVLGYTIEEYIGQPIK